MNDDTGVGFMVATGEERAASVFGQVANPLRLKIMARLEAGESRVSDLARSVGEYQTTVSRYLTTLRSHDLVTFRREGSTKFYRLTPLGLRFVELSRTL